MSAALQQNPQFQLKLSVVQGPHAGQIFHLNKDKITVGRGPENDVVLMNDPQVSRLHAQLVLVDRDFEIVKISQKNVVLVAGESVERWKLVNGSSFVIGDSEIRIDYDLGQAVVSVPTKKPADVIPLKPSEATHVGVPTPIPSEAPVGLMPSTSPVKSPVTAGPQAVTTRAKTSPPAQQARSMAVPRSQLPTQQQQQMLMQQQAYRLAQQQAQARQSRAAPPAEDSLLDNPKFRFYVIAGLILLGVGLFLMGPAKIHKSTKPKSTLKYEDEINIKLNSTSEKDKIREREDKKLDRKSPQYLRAQENFIRGMRDFSLGNYVRAQEFFQVVLNLDPGNQVAKRHLLLAQIRFDELVETKLMLGESYYNKHNFDMCLSMYQQVMNMLEDRRSETKYKLAERKAKECELAAEGIR